MVYVLVSCMVRAYIHIWLDEYLSPQIPLCIHVCVVAQDNDVVEA